ncbi:MAG: transporter substrate-binding domain-containing protein [Methylobacteriaceae bacterium]|nr:transporter substrate-binding domain-containing protein [Methylobacteriaceae bacterium]
MTGSSATDSKGQLISRRSLAAASLTTAVAAVTLGSAVAPSRALAAGETSGRLDRILKSGKLRVGQFLQYKPYGFKTPQGDPDGFDVDLTKMIAADMGVEPEFVDNTWEGIIPALLADKFDLITANMALTLKRSLAVQFASPHSFTSTAFVFKTQDKDRFSSIEKFNDPNITISVLIQDAVHITLQRFFPQAKVVDFNTADEAILAMQTGRADASGAEISYLTQYVSEHQGLSVAAVTIPGSSSPAGMALLPGPDNDHLKTFLNTWIEFYYWNGKFEPLWKKWIPWSPLPKVEKFMAPV